MSQGKGKKREDKVGFFSAALAQATGFSKKRSVAAQMREFAARLQTPHLS